jgi:hypothetical protein
MVGQWKPRPKLKSCLSDEIMLVRAILNPSCEAGWTSCCSPFRHE